MRMLSVLGSLVVLASAFDYQPTARAAYNRLLPYGDLTLCGGAGVVSLHGAVHGALGTAAATLGRLDTAVKHFRQAIVAGPLSKREQEIALLVAQGLTNKQIAAAVHISVRTVETHDQHILGKLGAATRTQIATWATQRKTTA
jgi:DNA-binding NarL/FixJ family response regulator